MTPRPGQPEQSADFDTQYRQHAKVVFHDIVRDELSRGADATEQAGIYAELGKPDFVLAYLLACPLADDQKRQLFAHAHERRAEHTEAKASELDRKFHRPFPMLLAEAARDRAAARNIRDGRAIDSGMDRRLTVM